MNTQHAALASCRWQAASVQHGCLVHFKRCGEFLKSHTVVSTQGPVQPGRAEKHPFRSLGDSHIGDASGRTRQATKRPTQGAVRNEHKPRVVNDKHSGLYSQHQTFGSGGWELPKDVNQDGNRKYRRCSPRQSSEHEGAYERCAANQTNDANRQSDN
jgi:hypothetical protein